MPARLVLLSCLVVVLVACDRSERSAAPTQAAPAPRPPPSFEGNWYVLDEGETVADFAARIGVPEETVRERGREVDRRWLAELERSVDERFPEVAEAWGGRIHLPHSGFSYVVREGEDVWTLADRFATSAIEILVVNGWTRDQAEALEPGLRLFVPGVVRTKSGEMVHLPTRPLDPDSTARAEALGLGTRAVAAKLLRGGMEDAWVEAAGGERGAGTFNWPVAGGWFVRGFGSGEEGYHLAVDVAGKIGWPVRAVDDGLVAYSGDGIRGYGNIVMIVHAGRFVSFYAHLSQSYAHAGEKVKRGDIIAETGSTGISKGPHVHFELIHDLRNCNPEPLFRPGMRRHDGTPIEVETAEWDGVGEPPETVRCAARPTRHPRSRWVVREGADPDPPPQRN